MINDFTSFQRAIICAVFGEISLITALLIFLPQIIKVIRTKNTSGSSLISYIIAFVCWMFWFIWANGFYFNCMAKGAEDIPKPLFMCQYMPVVISDTLAFVLSLILMIIKIRHVTLAKKMNVTELQLSEILLSKQQSKYLVDSKINIFKKNLPWITLIIFTIVLGVVLSIIYSFTTWPATPSVPVDDWKWVIVLNFIAAALAEALNWPQLIKCVKYKDTTGISLLWAIFFLFSAIIFLIYDLLLSFGTGTWSNEVIFSIIFGGYIPDIVILIIKVKNMKAAKKAGMSEVEYTRTILIPKVEQKHLKKI